MKCIAYSIFGEDRRYFVGLLRCIDLAAELYPDWRVIVYAEKALNSDWLNQLRERSVILETRKRESHWDGLYWRFEVFDRDDCECALIRDADSLLTQRETTLVDTWLDSEACLHIIRDHPDHEWPINAGMWGARNVFSFSMGAKIRDWTWKEAKFGDQHFLRKHVYKAFYGRALVHSSSIAYEGEEVVWIDPVEEFIGRVYFDRSTRGAPTGRRILKQPGPLREIRWRCELLWRKFEADLFRAR